MQESAQAFTTHERAMINRVLDLQKLTVRQIATPLAQVVTMEAQTPVRDALALAREKSCRVYRSAKRAMARRGSPDC